MCRGTKGKGNQPEKSAMPVEVRRAKRKMLCPTRSSPRSQPEAPVLEIPSLPRTKKLKRQLDNGMFWVHRIVDRRQEPNGEIKYLVEWDGFPSSYNTWEPKVNLATCLDLVAAIDEEMDKKKDNGIKSTPSLTQEIPILDSSPENSGDMGAESIESNPLPLPLTSTPKPTPDGPVKMIIQEKCPRDKVAKKIVGVMELNSILYYVVEWWNETQAPTQSRNANEITIPIPTSPEPDFGFGTDLVAGNERSLIPSSIFALKYPSLIIKFYEGHWLQHNTESK